MVSRNGFRDAASKSGVDKYLNRGAAMQAAGRLDDAESQYRAAVKRFPANALAYNNLATVLQLRGALDEAVVYLNKALTLDPHDGRIGVNMGVTFQLKNDHQTACRYLLDAIRNLASNSNHNQNYRVTAEMCLAHSLLSLGMYKEGWQHFEWRHHLPKLARLYYGINRPLWCGEPLEGKRLLVLAEQGLGDTLQFVRFLPELLKLGASRVTISVPLLLQDLVRSLGPVDIVSDGHLKVDYDFYIPLMSIPRILGTNAMNIPAKVPYIAVPSDQRTRAELLLPTPVKLRVGVAWQGNKENPNDKARSMQLTNLAPLFDVAGVEFVSLQLSDDVDTTGGGVPQLAALPLEAANLSLTAALMERVHLVVCVDTAIAHLAGSLGVQTWVFLPFTCDWRWLLNRSDCLWYPTMKLFRQERAGDWTVPVLAACKQLRLLAATTRHPLRTARQSACESGLTGRPEHHSTGDTSIPRAPLH